MISFVFRDRSHDFIQLLKLRFSQGREVIESFFESLIELLFIEDDFIVCLIKDELAIVGLVCRVFALILL